MNNINQVWSIARVAHLQLSEKTHVYYLPNKYDGKLAMVYLQVMEPPRPI